MRMTRLLSTGVGAILVAFAAATMVAAGPEWHKDLEGGMEAARKSGRPLLVVTAWKSGI